MAEEAGVESVRALFANASLSDLSDNSEGSETKETKDQAGDKPSAPGGAKGDGPAPEPKPGPDKSSLPEADAKAEKPAQDAANKSKFARERERREKTWAEINAEKESIKAEKEAVKTERERWLRERQEAESRIKQTAETVERDGHGYSVADYERAAKQFKEEGDAEMAGRAESAASQLKSKAAETATRAKVEQFQKAWGENIAKAEEKEPDLKNPQSELHKEVVAVLQNFPLLQQVPDGVLKALEAVKIQRRAAQADKHEAEAKKLKLELDGLQKKLSVNGGAPSEPLAEEKSFDAMPLAEQRKRLRAEFAKLGGSD